MLKPQPQQAANSIGIGVLRSISSEYNNYWCRVAEGDEQGRDAGVGATLLAANGPGTVALRALWLVARFSLDEAFAEKWIFGKRSPL